MAASLESGKGLGLFPSKFVGQIPKNFHLTSLLTPEVVIFVILTYTVYGLAYDLFFHPLRHVPGPWLARYSQIWRNHKYFRGRWHQDVLDLHRQYGNVVRIAPNEISFVDEAGLKALYGHGKQIQKTMWYDTWTVPNASTNFFATTDIKLHRHLRSRVTGVYSMSAVLSMEPLIQEVMDLNLKRLGQFADAGEAVSIDIWTTFFTFDVVGRLGLGGMLGFLEKGRDVDGIIASLHDGIYFMANMGNIPLQMFWLNNAVMKWMVRNFGAKRLNAFDDFLIWLDEIVEDRMKNGLGDRQSDMLQHFIEAKDQSGNPVKKGDVMIEGVNLLGAGADTTAIGILACLGYLLLHPEQKHKVIKEIDQAYDKLGLSESDREICFKDAEKLPFLSAVICESTRLHPSVQYQLPRLVPPGGIQLGSHFVPEGTVCGISPLAMNRSKEIFGSDADQFRPERWIPKDIKDDEKIKTQAALLTTFGMGSRNCVGKNLATVEIYKYIAQFFRHFDANLVDNVRPWNVETQWFSFQRDFRIVIKRRNTHVLG